jgi:cyclopropane fatty-acyl-phospholipid synthase-like methyltransferase
MENSGRLLCPRCEEAIRAMLDTASERTAKDTNGQVRDGVVDPQAALNAYFREEATHWAEIYERDGIEEAIHQERLRAALAMVDELALPPRSRVLDAGCSAGYATIALASRGLAVHALDPVETMVRTTRRRVADGGAQVAAQIVATFTRCRFPTTASPSLSRSACCRGCRRSTSRSMRWRACFPPADT